MEATVATAITHAWTDGTGGTTLLIVTAGAIASGSRIKPITVTIVTIAKTGTVIGLVAKG